ncbi:MAG: TIR domain-containing protein [Clostridia bacterium]|nr:TIR domain-containing protein [Clostridia bacterium]
MKDIFISYKSEDIEKARAVRDHLESEGLSVWMAPDSITGGASYAAEIPPAIDGAKVFLLVFTKNTQNSKWVSRELDRAINGNKIIIPLMLDDCLLNDEFSFYLTNVQRYPAFENYDKSLKKMTDEIKRYIAPQGQEAKTEIKKVEIPKPPKPKKPKKPGNVKKIGMAILGIILAVIVCSFVVSKLSSIEIAGETFKKDERSVYFYKKDISTEDLNKIATMKELRSIDFEQCKINAVHIGKITGENAYAISFRDCNLTKEQLSSLDFTGNSLNRIELSGCQLDSLDLIKGQEKLSTLIINNTDVSDISILKSFTKLGNFEASNCKITDISPLAECKELMNIVLDNNGIETLEPLGNLSLNNVYVSGNKLKNLNGLEKSIYLMGIMANDNQIENIDGLVNATQLFNVALNNNKISDISLLEKSAEKLIQVCLAGNDIEDASCLEKGSNIDYLSLADNKIVDISWLSNLKSLEGLDISRNMIEGNISLEGLNGLKYIIASGNKISGIKGKLTSDNYAVAAFDGTEMEDFDLEYTGNYKMLLLNDTKLSDYDMLYKSKGNLTLDYSEKLDLDKLKAAGYNKIVFIGVPLDKQVAVKEKLSSVYLEFVDKMEYEADKLIPDSLKGI